MLIIGTKSHGTFIAEVEASEIQKVFDKFARTVSTEPKVGDVFDLGAGHDFRREIKALCRDMLEAQKGFKRSQDTLLNFANMVAEQDDGEELRLAKECLDVANANYDALLAKHSVVLTQLGSLQLLCKNLVQSGGKVEFQMYLDKIKELVS